MDLIKPEIPATSLRSLPSHQDLAQAVHRLLSGKGPKIAVAESLTAGMLQDIIAMASGSSGYFEGGMTVYNAKQKIGLLNVPAYLCEKFNCVHPEVAEQMAFGVMGLYKADIGVATTGYAEPNPVWGIDEPMAYYCIVIGGESHPGLVKAPGLNRNDARQYVARYVLNELIELLAR